MTESCPPCQNMTNEYDLPHHMYTAVENQQPVGFILLASDKTTAKLVIFLLNCKD